MASGLIDNGSRWAHMPVRMDVLLDPRLTGTAVRVYMILLSQAEMGTTIMPYHELAVAACVKETTAKRAAKTLEDLGYLARKRTTHKITGEPGPPAFLLAWRRLDPSRAVTSPGPG